MSELGLFNNDLFSPKEQPKAIPQYIQKRVESSKSGNDSAFKTPIDWDQVIKLIRMFCTAEEIAGFLEISTGTLRIRVVVDGLADSWKEFYNTHRGHARTNLRVAQYKKAVDKEDTKLLIWLGKIYLNQSDTQIVLDEPPKDNEGYDLSTLSDDDLNAMEEILKKAEKRKGAEKNDL